MIGQEVISIGGSSSEDTRCGASNNESSFLERMRVARRIGGALLALVGGRDLLLLSESLPQLL